jgi:MFS family permease
MSGRQSSAMCRPAIERQFWRFLALRSLFGVAMGGIWGLAAATSLENLPMEVRGLASGVVHQGYAVGYLIAAAGYQLDPCPGD